MLEEVTKFIEGCHWIDMRPSFIIDDGENVAWFGSMRVTIA